MCNCTNGHVGGDVFDIISFSKQSPVVGQRLYVLYVFHDREFNEKNVRHRKDPGKNMIVYSIFGINVNFK